MERLTKAQMTERLGKAPESWTFFGQCYRLDETDRVCGLTGLQATTFFTLKPRDGSKGRLAVSDKSIDLFKRWNPDLYVRLKQGLMFLELQTLALESDKRAARQRQRVRNALAHWRTAKSRARNLIQQYRSTVRRGALPEYLQFAREIIQEPVLEFQEENSRILWLEQQVIRLENTLSFNPEPETAAPETTPQPPRPDPMAELWAIANEEEAVQQAAPAPQPEPAPITFLDIPEIMF